MPQEREKSLKLTVTDYDIAGNVFRVWRDDNADIVFVIDDTIDDYKPYALLVIGAYDDRKWDDVLSNDFHMNLEEIRPKKENKYQKLDIEYGGIEFYARLVDAYESGQNIEEPLRGLYDFRDAAVRRAATERLVAATEVIEQSAKTATGAERSITNFQQRHRVLAERLERWRNSVGREPPKESAARILKVESQIEKNDAKIERAKKRLDNAVRRGDAAREDVDVARDILSRRRPDLDSSEYEINHETTNQEVLEEKKQEINKMKIQDDAGTRVSLPVPDYDNQSEPQETTMPDKPETEEVKPLLDENPEILDEEIAFKPVAFEDITPASAVVSDNANEESETNESAVVNETPVANPLSFSENNAQTQNEYDVPDDYRTPEPVLNTIQSVEEPKGADVDTTGQVSNTQYDNAPKMSAPVAPVVPPATSGARPISPITGASSGVVKPVGGSSRSKPTVFYYFLLMVLIALSVFTLWLYQKKNGGKVPFVDNTTVPEITVTQPDVISKGDTFSEPVPVAAVEPEPVVVSEPEPEPEPVIEPEPEPVVEPDAPVTVEYPNVNVLRAAEPEVQEIESEDSVLARKQPYGVSRDSQNVYAPEPRVTNIAAPDVIFDEDVISVPALAPGYVDEEEAYYSVNGDDAEYYPNSGGYYDVQPASHNEYSESRYQDSFEDDGYYNGGYIQGESDGGFDMESGGATDDLGYYDGGQYSVGFHEEIY